MDILSKITTGRLGRAQKVCIYAPEGFGKSTLASQFPFPLFLDIEDSTSQMDVLRIAREALPDLAVVESVIAEIIAQKACSTLVIDTIDWLETMALEAIIAEADNPKIKGIEDFGYGKGYTILKERVTVLLAKFDTLIQAGINVVLLGHAKISKFESPELTPFDRWEMKLSRQVTPLIKEWCDALLFGNWKTALREPEEGKAKGVGGKERVLYCAHSATVDAKNRHGLAEIEKWEIATLKRAFAAVNAPWPEEKPKQAENGAPVVMPPAGTPAGAPIPVSQDSVVDSALASICAPHAEAVTAHLRKSGKIKDNETWEAMPKDFAARVLKNPAAFLKVVNSGNGKAVAA